MCFRAQVQVENFASKVGKISGKQFMMIRNFEMAFLYRL